MRREAVTTVLALLVTAVWITGSTRADDGVPGPLTSSPSFAAGEGADGGDGAEEPIVGSDSKGKYFYKKECKSCHGRDGEGGEITPISKTIKQWERFFAKNEHVDSTLDSLVTEEQLIHIRTFLINHAADSDQPETCG